MRCTAAPSRRLRGAPRTCAERLARYKRLIGPMEFLVDEKDGTLSVEITCGDADLAMPSFLVQVEFAFLVNLIRTATRELLAKHYLKTTAMGTDQIAYLLGYLELNSFLRAFNSWCGMSPSEWRRRNT